MKYKGTFELSYEIKNCKQDCPFHQMKKEHKYKTMYSESEGVPIIRDYCISAKKIIYGNKRPKWCPLQVITKMED